MFKKPATACWGKRARKPNCDMELAAALDGVVKRAYPLRQISAADRENQGREADETRFDLFTLGCGPCCHEATQVMTLEVETHDRSASYVVYFYDEWATKVSSFQRHYKVRIEGHGLLALDWDDGEDRRPCFVVADRFLLKKTLQRDKKLFNLPPGTAIKLTYETPERLPESRQLSYLPAKTIDTRMLLAERSLAINPLQKIEPSGSEAHPPPTTKISKRKATTIEKYGKRLLPQAESSSYVYTPIRELISGHACVYGVVMNVSLPKQTSGRDFHMSVHIVDESLPKREQAMNVQIFRQEIGKMPKILYVGDVIRFHKLNVQTYQHTLQGVCASKGSRYLVLRANADGSVKQQTDNEHWTFETIDEERCRQLAKWSHKSLREDTTLPPGCPSAPTLLAETKHSEAFTDILVRVLSIEDDTPARLIVRDGSGSIEQSNDRLVRYLQHRNVTVPAHGLVMEIIVDGCWAVLKEIGFADKLTSHWCRFRNLSVTMDEGINGLAGQGMGFRFREVSSLVLVPDYVSDVQDRLKSINGAGSSSLTSNPTAQVETSVTAAAPVRVDSSRRVTTAIPSFIMEKVPISSLREILQDTRVPRKFHALVRVVGIWPECVENITKRQAPSGDFIYSFAARVQDDSGSLDVILHGKDAERFLHGIPPCDLSRGTSSKALLEKRFSALFSWPHPLHCCIKSYYPASASGGKKPVRYQVFDTLMSCS